MNTKRLKINLNSISGKSLNVLVIHQNYPLNYTQRIVYFYGLENLL